jgi:hypothetical protein
MLRLLFQSLESLFGAALGDVARVVYLAGALVLLLAALRPFWGLWADWRTDRAGLAERWVGACRSCGITGPLWQGACSACGADLGLPWVVRWRTRGAAWLASPTWQRAAQGYRLAGALLFAGAAGFALWGVVSPAGDGALHRLFAGLGFLALAVAGFAFGRALGPARRGLVGRAGYVLHGMAAVGLLAVLLFLAAAARPVAETRLVAVAPRPNVEGEVGLEYLQVDHELLGFRRIVPLACLGAERTPLGLAAPTRWAVAHLRAHADDWERRGLTVRLRRDMRRVTPGERYEIVESGGQIFIRRAGA